MWKDQGDSGSMSVVGTDNGEAMPKQWYVVRTRMHCERRVAERLAELGLEIFLPMQPETHQWSDRKKKVNRILLPMMVFVRLTEAEKKAIRQFSYILGLLSDRTRGDKPAIIPDYQMQRFIFMITHADTEVCIEPLTFRRGDTVRIRAGKLAGLEGTIIDSLDGKTKIVIRLDHLACASVEVERKMVELV